MSVTLISVSQDTVVSNKHEERTRHYYVIFQQQQCLSLDECIEMQHTEVGEAAGSEYEWWPGACFRAVAIIHDVADSVQVQALVDTGLQVAAAGRPHSGLGLGKQGGM